LQVNQILLVKLNCLSVFNIPSSVLNEKMGEYMMFDDIGNDLY